MSISMQIGHDAYVMPDYLSCRRKEKRPLEWLTPIMTLPVERRLHVAEARGEAWNRAFTTGHRYRALMTF